MFCYPKASVLAERSSLVHLTTVNLQHSKANKHPNGGTAVVPLRADQHRDKTAITSRTIRINRPDQLRIQSRVRRGSLFRLVYLVRLQVPPRLNQVLELRMHLPAKEHLRLGLYSRA